MSFRDKISLPFNLRGKINNFRSLESERCKLTSREWYRKQEWMWSVELKKMTNPS
jgi:hypothetical protein